MSSFTVRLALPPRWFQLGRDDPGAWMGAFVQQELPQAGELEQNAFTDPLIDAYGIVELTGAVDALAWVPEPESGPQAFLFAYPSERRALLRRGAGAYATPLERALRGSTPVERTEVALVSGPTVRLRGTAPDELGRPVEQVLHVVVPAGAPGAVVIRMQWAPGRPDADELAATADRIARDALVELL